MCVYIGRSGPFDEEAIVLRVLDRSFDVYVRTLGIEQRVYCDKHPIEYRHNAQSKSLRLVWNTSYIEDPETGERSPGLVEVPAKDRFVQEITALKKVQVRLTAVKNTKDVKIDVVTELIPPVVLSSTIPLRGHR